MKDNGKKIESPTLFPSAGEFLEKAKTGTFTDARNICMQIYGLLRFLVLADRENKQFHISSDK